MKNYETGRIEKLGCLDPEKTDRNWDQVLLRRRQDQVRDFLRGTTPKQLEEQLNQYIIGQPQLTREVADFIYYHGLRQCHSRLFPRNLMISGPSGSGKTEVWRVVKRLYGHVFPVVIIDGSRLRADGWSGSYKLVNQVTGDVVNGGILVVDEFDKLARPVHSSNGDNASLTQQSELLKLLEGEFAVGEQRVREATANLSRSMGIVLVGAFEDIWEERSRAKGSSIGFTAQSRECKLPQALTERELIQYGVMPEVVGRIATICSTRELENEDYWRILRSEHSRLSVLRDVLSMYGIEGGGGISPQKVQELMIQSRENRTGVRWVVAQMESIMLKQLRDRGVGGGRCFDLDEELASRLLG